MTVFNTVKNPMGWTTTVVEEAPTGITAEPLNDW